MQNLLPKEQYKRILAFTALNVFGLFLIFELHEFISPFLGAVIFYVLFNGLMNRLVTRFKWRPSLAATLIMFLSFIIILIPIFSFSYLLYAKISVVINDPSSLLSVF